MCRQQLSACHPDLKCKWFDKGRVSAHLSPLPSLPPLPFFFLTASDPDLFSAYTKHFHSVPQTIQTEHQRLVIPLYQPVPLVLYLERCPPRLVIFFPSVCVCIMSVALSIFQSGCGGTTGKKQLVREKRSGKKNEGLLKKESLMKLGERGTGRRMVPLQGRCQCCLRRGSSSSPKPPQRSRCPDPRG
mmetsp:Transcript_52271/g.109082  ORF Transcript_52271/g.109082 Transcript_52271/m.109082 type:complete len:187 (-) Transcript_52271:752-1312(-)